MRLFLCEGNFSWLTLLKKRVSDIDIRRSKIDSDYFLTRKFLYITIFTYFGSLGRWEVTHGPIFTALLPEYSSTKMTFRNYCPLYSAFHFPGRFYNFRHLNIVNRFKYIMFIDNGSLICRISRSLCIQFDLK